MAPAAENGYGPNMLDRNAMISGWRASDPSITPATCNCTSSEVRTQSFGLGSLPAGGPGTVQPSNGWASASNDVVPLPVETTTSSTPTPAHCTESSLA